MKNNKLNPHYLEANILEDNRELIKDFLQRLIAQSETIGVCVLGSSARSGLRPFVDKWSDLDIALFIDMRINLEYFKLKENSFFLNIQDSLPKWLPNFKFRIPKKLLKTDRQKVLEINVHQFILSYEEQKNIVWPRDRREAFLYTCDIIYDPTGRVKELLKNKAIFCKKEWEERVIINLSRIPVIIEHAVDKCINRKLFLDAHLAINECIEKLVELIFDLNMREMTDLKWRMHTVSQFPKLPINFDQRIKKAILINDLTETDILRRKKILGSLFEDVKYMFKKDNLLSYNLYSKFVTQIKKGWQLARFTSADDFIGRNKNQYHKMNLESWNEFNYFLKQ